MSIVLDDGNKDAQNRLLRYFKKTTDERWFALMETAIDEVIESVNEV